MPPELPYKPAQNDPDRIFYCGSWHPRCRFISSTTGERCARIADRGKDHCGDHASQQRNRYRFKDSLAKNFEKALDDPELLSLRANVAMVEVRIAELVEGLEADASQQVWKDLTAWLDKLRRARKEGDAPGFSKALGRLEELIDQGSSTQKRWEDLFGAIKLKKEVAGAEWDRLTDLRCLMTAERAFHLFGKVVDIVMKHVKDPGVRMEIGTEMRLVMSGAPSASPITVERVRAEEREITDSGTQEGG